MSDFRPGAELEQGLVSIGGGIGREAHDSEHLREAVRVTARGDGDRVEIQLGHFCNNRCVFCVSGQLTEQKLAPRIELEPIVAALEAAAERGVRRVTFLGGEPTIQPSFQPALERAVALDFEEIVIFTNGVRTWKAPFMEHVVSLGRFTWRFSLQGGDEETHDRVVGRRGAFERIRRGMLWLSERQQDITVNMCVNGHSYRSLPLFPELLVGRGPRQLHVDTVRPNGAGVRSEQELDGLLVPYSDMAPFFEAMLQGFSELDPSFEVHVGNLPYCVLPGWTAWLHHGGEATATVTTDNSAFDAVLEDFHAVTLRLHASYKF